MGRSVDITERIMMGICFEVQPLDALAAQPSCLGAAALSPHLLRCFTAFITRTDFLTADDEEKEKSGPNKGDHSKM
jgi:hypothetical protein